MKKIFLFLTAALIIASAAASVSASAAMSAGEETFDNGFRISKNSAYTLSFEIDEKEYYTEESVVFEGKTNLPAETLLDIQAVSSDGKTFSPAKETVTIYLKDADDDKYTVSGYANFDLEPDTYSLVLSDPATGTESSEYFRIIATDSSPAGTGESVTTGHSLSIKADKKEYSPGDSISFAAKTNLPEGTTYEISISDEDGTGFELSKVSMTEPYVESAGDNYYTIKGYADADLPYPESFSLIISDKDTGVSASDAFRVVGYETTAGTSGQTQNEENQQSQNYIRVRTDMTCSQTGIHKPGEELTVLASTTFEPETTLQIRIYDAETHTIVFSDETTTGEGSTLIEETEELQWNDAAPVSAETEGWDEGKYILEAEGPGGITDTFGINLDETAYNTYQNKNENQNSQDEDEEETENNEDDEGFAGFFRHFFRFFGAE